MAGSAGSIRLEDFVIPRTEKVSQFQVRDGKFLEDNATRVAQSAEERTVRCRSSHDHTQLLWLPCILFIANLQPSLAALKSEDIVMLCPAVPLCFPAAFMMKSTRNWC